MSDFDPEILTREKSIRGILRKYIPTMSFDFNFAITFITLLLLIFYVVFTDEKIDTFLVKLRTILDWEFTYIITILGFIVTGFSIFAAVTDKEIFILKALTKTNCGVNDLKLSFFRFMYVFSVYIVVVFVLAMLKIFACQACLISTIFSYLNFERMECVKFVLVKATFVFAGTSFSYSILLLKSFIFNIYKIMIGYVRLKIELRKYNFDQLYDIYLDNYKKDQRNDS